MSQQDNKKPENPTNPKQEVMTLNCLGDICPLPMMKFKEMKKALQEGREIMLVTDHSCAAENVLDYCRSLHYAFEVEEPISGVWEITVHQNPDPPAGEFPEEEDSEEYEEDQEEEPEAKKGGSIWHW